MPDASFFWILESTPGQIIVQIHGQSFPVRMYVQFLELPPKNVGQLTLIKETPVFTHDRRVVVGDEPFRPGSQRSGPACASFSLMDCE